MTSAFNLSQLANKVNTSGQLDATTGLDGIVPVANLGTGTPTSAKFLRGDGSWASSSSTFLAKELPLKSGKTLTAGRAVNINSSGEVGDYPVVNTLGTLVQNTTTTYAPSFDPTNGILSTDGSRLIKFVNQDKPSSGNPFGVRGVALTSTGQTTGGTTNLSPSGGYNFIGWAKPINETQFLIAYITSSGTGYYDNPTTMYGYARVATVDSSGNVTLGTANSFSQGNVYLGYGAEMYLSQLPSGRFAMYSYVRDTNYNTVYYNSRTFSISGTTITSTSDTDLDFFSNYPAFVTTNNKLVGINVYNFYYCNYDGTTTSSYASTNIATNARGGQYMGILLSASYGLIAYNKSNYDFVLETFSINQTTGVPTVTSTYVIVPATSVAVTDIRFAIISSTEVVISYKIGTTTYALSLKLNATAQVIGKGIPVVLNSTGNIVYDIIKSGASAVRFVYDISSSGYSQDLTINTYDTLSWVSVGATSTSQTTSPAEIVTGGVCSGFTGLSAGTKYYVNEATYDGQVTSTQGSFLVGTAISSTEILLG